MRQLQPNAGYMRLFREIVLDVWLESRVTASKCKPWSSARLASCARTRQRWKRHSSIKKTIDVTTYQEMRAKLVEDLTLAEMELREAQTEEIEIETVLDYAEMVLTNASNLWITAPSEQKQRLQQVLFPEGVTYTEGNYRTAVTCLLFSRMKAKASRKKVW